MCLGAILRFGMAEKLGNFCVFRRKDSEIPTVDGSEIRNNHLGCIIFANNGMITVSTGAGFLPSTVLTFTETTSLEGPHPNCSKSRMIRVPFNLAGDSFECNSVKVSPRGAGKPKVFPGLPGIRMGTFAQIPAFSGVTT